jgi:hypothetical protein
MSRNNLAIAISLGLAAAGSACAVEGDEQASIEEEVAGEPVYPTGHPRIYLSPNRARLKAALDSRTAAATRFRSRVDSWVGGTNIWGFQAWNAALLSQLTGTTSYCTKAVATVESQVATAEAQIASGAQPEVAHDSYLHVGELIGDLALVYDWCFPQVTSSQRTRWIAYAVGARA